MLVGAYVRILPGVYTPRFPSCEPRPTPLARVHGHARLSRVNSPSFSPPCDSRTSRPHPPFVTPPPSVVPALSMKTRRATPYVRSHHPGVKTRARDIPSHENLIANPAEAPGCKSFRELTSTVHENYARARPLASTRGKQPWTFRFRKFRAGVLHFP